MQDIKQLALEEAQRNIEATGVELGAQNAQARHEKSILKDRIDRTAGGQVAARMIFTQAMDGIEAMIKNAPPAARASLKWAEKLGAAACTHITLTNMFNRLEKKNTQVALAIGRQIRAELNALALAEGYPGLAHYLFEEIKKSGSGRHRSSVLSAARKRLGVPDLADMGFDEETLLMLGLKLIDAVIANTGAFMLVDKYEVVRGVQQTNYYIEAAPALVKLMQQADEKALWMQPVRPVMITPPRDWDADLKGGYLTAGQQLDFITGASSEYLQSEIEEGRLDNVFRAINTLQKTPLRINKRVLEVVQQVWDSDLAYGILPQRAEREVPAKPNEGTGLTVDQFKEASPAEWKQWKRDASEVHAFNQSAERLGKLRDLSQTLDEAARYADYDAIYMPVQVDFRGRMYYVPTALNLQADDLNKGLIEFSHGVALTAKGARSLAIVGATLWANDAVDKLPLEARHKWVLDNEDKILRSAKDPLGFTWWAEADGGQWDPEHPEDYLKGATAWSFLSFCFEWAKWKDEGEGVLSHFISFADGKCNGTQHHAALMRAEQEAQYVCMLPMTVPDDFYSRVLDVVNGMIGDKLNSTAPFGKQAEEDEDDAHRPVGYEEGQLAQMLNGKIKRTHVKRPSMTYSYGVTLLGIRTQFKNDFKSFWKQFPAEARKPLIAMLSNMSLEGVETVARASAESKRFLQDVAKIACKSGLPVAWTTPDGFTVRQEYLKTEAIRVRTVISGGTRVRIDRTADIQKLFFRAARAAIKAVLKDDNWTEGVVNEIREMVSYPRLRALSEQYRNLFENERLDEMFGVCEALLDECLTGDMIKLKAGLAELLVRAVSEGHEHMIDGDNTMRATLRKSTGKLDTSKQVSAMAPNFVHSLDACHLRMTVNACADAGITNFVAVHDSFGCHAEHYDDMNRILREQFVKMYSETDPFQDLLDIIKQQVTEDEAKKLPARPPMGTLDLELVKEAPFFFA